MDVIERFLRLVAIDSTSDENNPACPSSEGQLAAAREIAAQLRDLGIEDVSADENGYVFASIKANTDAKLPVYGLIAHMDTSDAASGADIKPRITEPYDGGDIVLNEEKNILLSPADFPSLKNHIGKKLIVTDGTTLLGADDKAGAAEIIAAAEILLHTDRPHGEVRLGFTPDEEIGRGTDYFDIEAFGADYAYTVDGGPIGSIEFENFNAASASVEIRGRSIHPGSAKNKMINAALVAMEFNGLLPELERPEHTEGYEGFFHLTDMRAETENALLRYIIRDHDAVSFERRKAVILKAGEEIDRRYGAGTAVVTVKDAYRNMREKIEPCMFLIEDACEVMRSMGIKPFISPVRGGTDGANLSWKGLPCPNLCTGGENCHGRFEFIPSDDMVKISEMLAEIILNVGKNAK